jgi:hypothetical protein
MGATVVGRSVSHLSFGCLAARSAYSAPKRGGTVNPDGICPGLVNRHNPLRRVALGCDLVSGDRCVLADSDQE